MALRELGERGVFPHVGTATEVVVRGHQVFPLVTGTFGSVDFLHSVLGEIDDRIKESEIQQLHAQLVFAADKAQENGGELLTLKELLTELPPGVIDDDCMASINDLEERSNAKAFQTKARIDDGQTAWDYNTENLAEQLYPFMAFHDKVMKDLAGAMEEIPSHAELYGKIQNSLALSFFSLISPFMLPVLRQIRAELAKASREVINSGREKQHVVFRDPYSSDPTHSMLSKDHFTNILNEPAGKIATEIVKFVVPLIMRAWDDEAMEVEPLIDYVLGVFHHPVCRDENKHRGQGTMFSVVRDWWESKSSAEKKHLRDVLSMDGVKAGRNHEGKDTGHGCSAAIAGAGKNPGDATGGYFSSANGQLASSTNNESGGYGSFIGSLGGVAAGILGSTGAVNGNTNRGNVATTGNVDYNNLNDGNGKWCTLS